MIPFLIHNVGNFHPHLNKQKDVFRGVADSQSPCESLIKCSKVDKRGGQSRSVLNPQSTYYMRTARRDTQYSLGAGDKMNGVENEEKHCSIHSYRLTRQPQFTRPQTYNGFAPTDRYYSYYSPQSCGAYLQICLLQGRRATSILFTLYVWTVEDAFTHNSCIHSQKVFQYTMRTYE